MNRKILKAKQDAESIESLAKSLYASAQTDGLSRKVTSGLKALAAKASELAGDIRSLEVDSKIVDVVRAFAEARGSKAP